MIGRSNDVKNDEADLVRWNMAERCCLKCASLV